MKLTAKVVPFSSIVGSSVMLHDESSNVVCQLALLNTARGDDPSEWRRQQESLAQEVASRFLSTPVSAASPEGEEPGEGNGWFKLTGDARLGVCATDGCGGQPAWRLERDGVGSEYCSGCAATIRGVAVTPHVPEGFVLVPVEPTEAMIEAARVDWQERLQKKFDGRLPYGDHRLSLVATYRSMLAASPFTQEKNRG